MAEEHDIVIVGTGIAGGAAGVAALEEAPGLDVAFVERAPEGRHGGNSRHTTSLMRLEADGSPVEGFAEDLRTYSRGRTDGALVETLAEEARPSIRWLEEYGVEFAVDGPEESAFLASSESRLRPEGKGIAVVEALLSAAVDAGATVYYETTADALHRGDDGEIAGVYVRDGAGESRQIQADAVVLAAGGFEGNDRMLTQYVDETAGDVTPIAPGGEFNRGEGIEMAIDAGAKTAGQFSRFHAEPGDPRTDEPDPKVLAFPYGILVNRDGERFVDEGARTPDEHYATVARAIRDQPCEVAYLLADRTLYDIDGVERAIATPLPPYEAGSAGDDLDGAVTSLASEAGIDGRSLLETIESYNDAVTDEAFDPYGPDGKRAETDPPKSNWARPIEEPPLVAYPLECRNIFTFGGLAIDTDGRVLNGDDRPIPGLYAAGEITGFFYHRYPGGTSVLRGLVFGRRAGADGAAYVGRP